MLCKIIYNIGEGALVNTEILRGVLDPFSGDGARSLPGRNKPVGCLSRNYSFGASIFVVERKVACVLAVFSDIGHGVRNRNNTRLSHELHSVKFCIWVHVPIAIVVFIRAVLGLVLAQRLQLNGFVSGLRPLCGHLSINSTLVPCGRKPMCTVRC